MSGFVAIKQKALPDWLIDLDEDVSPLFFPVSEYAAKTELLLKINRSPQAFGKPQSRWTLKSLLDSVKPVFKLETQSGLWQVMKKLGISYQRARAYVHSPDPLYEEKLAYIQRIISLYKKGEIVVLFADQFTYYNHAEVNRAFARHHEQPKAHRAIGGARQRRIAACMNCFTGQVTYVQRQRTSIPALIQLYKDVCQVYDQAKMIYIILDNWPVHYHPDILEAFVPQTNPFSFKLPKSWEHLKPKGKYKELNLPVQLVSLPTYASWLNPIEKLWKLLKKELIHHHDFAHHFKELFTKVEQFLDDLEKPSTQLLSFAGLLKEDGIFAPAILKAEPGFFNSAVNF